MKLKRLMMKHSLCVSSCLAMAIAAFCQQPSRADGPQFQPPHGMLVVEFDEDNKLFSNSGAAGFAYNPTDPASVNRITVNTTGNTILKHDLGGEGILGGIAERDGELFTQAATADSTVLWADDPGFAVGGGVFPPNTLISVNFHNSLQYYDPAVDAWMAPPGDEQIRVFQWIPGDQTGANDADLEVILDTNGVGRVGRVNLDVTKSPPTPGSAMPGFHAHVGYELSRPGDGGVPAFGAYMMEISLSARQFPDMGGPSYTDSDSIFVVFNNQLDPTDFESAVSAAEVLPEPTAAMMVLTLGSLGLVGLRRRRLG